MAKIDKLALARLALRHALLELDTCEKLCVLADMYIPPDKEKEPGMPRWYGNGSGTSGLEQGFYGHMTTFRRIASLWSKIRGLSPDLKHEAFLVRDLLVESLNGVGITLPTLPQEAANE
jgi:hypothetical protein